jgi:DNA polymerase-3 subunit gamma/tau
LSYTVLARRYRSTSFDELVGQEPIARTLRSAIETGRAAHAYLFCGTRGVGKTSMARIFAKALNTAAPLAQKEEIAKAILRGDDLDVIEIDAASNRGVQEARDLIAGAGLSPARCPYKIYIIDEVHMLTREAFNALLKTMEEPPAHVKFILCTTDPQKVPATIQSRCQRFDFRAIPTAVIANQLRRILADEGVEADDDVVHLVARLGHGSMRDALSLLDRLLAAGERTLTAALAEEMLGLPDLTLVFEVVRAIVASEPAAALRAGAELIARGASEEQALEMLAEHFHTMMVAAACGPQAELLEVAPDVAAAAAEQAAHFDVPGLVHMIAVCDAAARSARGSAIARALFDAALVRLCRSEHLADVAALLAIGAGAPITAAKKKIGAADAAPARDPALIEVKSASAAPAPAPRVPVGPDAASPPAPAAPDPQDGAALWREVVTAAAGGDRSRVQQLALRGFDGRTLRLAVREEAAATARYIAGQAERIAELVQRVTGRRVAVHIEAAAEAGPTAAAPATAPPPRLGEAHRLPVVERAMEIFDAIVVDVREDEAPGAGDAGDPERDLGV